MEFESILKRIKGWTEYIYLHVMGEPFLHPDIGRLLDISDFYGFNVNLTTNGTLLGEDASRIVLDKSSLRQVNISLHSFEANEGQYSLDDYLDGVLRFTQAALDGGRTIVSLRLWNASEEGRNDRNAYIVKRISEAFMPDLNIGDIPVAGRGLRLAERLYINMAPVFQWPGTGEMDFGEEGFCLGLRDQAAILVDGTVVPCCLDGEGTVALGNIFLQSLGEILRSPRAVAVAQGFSRRQPAEELCRKCGYRGRFV